MSYSSRILDSEIILMLKSINEWFQFNNSYLMDNKIIRGIIYSSNNNICINVNILIHVNIFHYISPSRPLTQDVVTFLLCGPLQTTPKVTPNSLGYQPYSLAYRPYSLVYWSIILLRLPTVLPSLPTVLLTLSNVLPSLPAAPYDLHHVFPYGPRQLRSSKQWE